MMEKLSSLCVRFMPTFVSPATSMRSGPPTTADRRVDALVVSTTVIAQVRAISRRNASVVLRGLSLSHGSWASPASLMGLAGQPARPRLPHSPRKRRRGSRGGAKGHGNLAEAVASEDEQLHRLPGPLTPDAL